MQERLLTGETFDWDAAREDAAAFVSSALEELRWRMSEEGQTLEDALTDAIIDAQDRREIAERYRARPFSWGAAERFYSLAIELAQKAL